MKKQIVCCLIIVFSCPLFLSAQQKQDLTAEDILSMSLLEMMQVEVVTASKMAQRVSDVAATMKVITADEIKNRGYFNLEDALADLPGFQFRDIQGFNTYSFLRGIPNQNNLILLLIDGIQINEMNSGGFYGGGQYNLSNVEQIEVVYGPASALYGTNAVSGIINIITKKPKDGHSAQISQTAGNFRTYETDLSYGYRNAEKDMGFRVSGMIKSSEKADLAGEAGDNNWTDDMENFERDYGFDGSFQLKDFSVGVNLLEKQASMTTSYKTVNDKYLDRNTSWNIRFLNVHAQYNLASAEKFTDHFKVYYRNATVRDNTVDNVLKATDNDPGSQVGFYRPNQLLGAENQFIIRPLESLLLTGGIVYEFEQLAKGFTKSYSESQDIIPEPPVEPEMLGNHLVSLYLQEEFYLAKWLNLVGGVRQDFSTYYGNVLTPRIALIGKTGGFTGRLLYNKAFRAPRPWDFTSGIGNDDLKSEKMGSTELNISYLLGENFMLEGSGYINHVQGVFAKEYLTDSDWFWINEEEVNTMGSEIGFRYSKSKLTSFLNYSYNDSKNQEGMALKEIAKHSANLGITYQLNRNIIFYFGSHYFGKRQNPKTIQATGTDWLDPALVLNANLSYLDFNGFDIQLAIRNLTNVEYYHTSNKAPDRYRQPQRTFLLTLRFALEK